MRIAIFTDTFYPQVNGVTNTLDYLIDYLEKNNHEFLIISPNYGEPIDRESELSVLRLKAHRFLLYPECRLAFPNYLQIYDRIITFQPDIMHITTEYTIGLCGLTIAKDFDIPIVMSYHTNFDQYLRSYHLKYLENTYWSYMKWFHNHARINLCPSYVTLNDLQNRGFKNLDIWSRGVDLRCFHPKQFSKEIRTSFNAGNKIIVLYAGRIAREKGLDILLKAIRMLNKRYFHEVQYIFTGDGPYLNELKAHNIRNVVFTGVKKKDELSKIYASSDIFVFPSGTETFGNVVLEAMASGLPVVCTDSGGVTDFTSHLHNAYITKYNSHRSLARGLHRLITDRSLREKLGKCAYETALLRSWDNIFDDLMKAYKIAERHTESIRYLAG